MSRQPQDPTSGKGETAKADLQQDLEQGKQQAAQLGEDAKREAKSRAEAGTARAADEIDQVAGAMDAAASQLRDSNAEGLAEFAARAARSMSDMSERLRHRSVDELAEDASRLARDNPAMFLLGGVAIGFGLARFLKASAERDHYGAGGSERRDDYGAGYGGRGRHTSDAGPGDVGPGMGVPAYGADYGMTGATGAADAGTSIGGSSETLPGAEAPVPDKAMQGSGPVPEQGPTGTQTTNVTGSDRSRGKDPNRDKGGAR